VEPPILFISHCTDLNCLSALEYGRVFDGQPPECWEPLDEDEQFAFYRHPDSRSIAGFHIVEFSDFDPDELEGSPVWTGPRFTAPLLGLSDVPAGEIVVAADRFFAGRDSLNRSLFRQAMGLEGEEALAAWLAVLETGDSMAHFALGYTLYELQRFRLAYRHLRYYAEIAPHASWNWSWLAKAAAAIGQLEEARRACRCAIALTEAGDAETDAAELLVRLGGGPR